MIESERDERERGWVILAKTCSMGVGHSSILHYVRVYVLIERACRYQLEIEREEERGVHE